MSKIETIFTHKSDSGAEGALGIDSEGKLYWNGRPVATQSRVTLDWWVNIAAIVASASTFVMALYTVLDHYYC
ncbi:MAG: hypothetical protein QG606_306 [Patescibacteria group bacterium]|nr:hypothetical protein [Patescibacteria group bacterium]